MLRPEILVFMIPIVAIVMGIGSGMLKMHYSHKERMMNHMSGDQIAEPAIMETGIAGKMSMRQKPMLKQAIRNSAAIK